MTTGRHGPYAVAEDFDRRLGDPADPGRAFSYERCAGLDRAEEFPDEICRELDVAGVPGYYVPEEYGGSARDYEELYQVIRAVARRDLTVAIGHVKTYLGAVSAWVGAEHAQAKRLADEVIAGTVVSWGLTERDHGSDLLAGDVVAVPVDGGFRITGEKWLINNATRGRIVCVLARTDPAGGPRGFSLLLVDKAKTGAYEHLPAVRTVGIRGTDISGIRLDDVVVGADALIGEPGGGFEIVLKGLQLTRVLCTSLSLGAADQALRIATRFTLEHRMYDRRLIDLPQARRTLAEAYADVLIADVVGLVASRSTHALTAEMSVVSAVTKYFVPSGADRLIRELGQVLGARAFLAETYRDGMFAKIERDHRIVGIFDGNTLVNLNAMINQFPGLVRAYRFGLVDEPGLRTATTLSEPLKTFDRDLLRLVSGEGCSVVQSIPALVDETRKLAESGRLPSLVAEQAGELRAAADEIHRGMAALRPSLRDVPAEAFELAERYSLCFAAAACLQFYLRNAREDGELWADARWLRACLARLLDRLRPGDVPGDDDVLDELTGPLLAQYEQGLLFSPLDCRLAEGAP